MREEAEEGRAGGGGEGVGRRGGRGGERNGRGGEGAVEGAGGGRGEGERCHRHIASKASNVFLKCRY